MVWFAGFARAETINSPELVEQFAKELTSPQGVTVEVHGVDASNGLYVISFRPQNFFDYVILSLQADYTSPNYLVIKKQLATLKRHDQLQIKGSLNGLVSSPQNHVLMNELTIVSQFSPPMSGVADYAHYTKLLKEVADKTELIVKVHASLVDGKIFVVEYGDANIPIIVKDNSRTKDLYRGDKVKIRYVVSEFPTAPVHLLLEAGPQGVDVLDAIAAQHEQPQDRCGSLVMFPKSPQVKFNVFALMTDIGDNLFRTYTLINFEDVDLFFALRDKAQAAWDANSSTVVAGRNYYVNPKLQVCAKGMGNMIVPTQANPQIVIESLEDLTFKTIP